MGNTKAQEKFQDTVLIIGIIRHIVIHRISTKTPIGSSLIFWRTSYAVFQKFRSKKTNELEESEDGIHAKPGTGSSLEFSAHFICRISKISV